MSSLHKGFTLIELLIVIAIVGILVSVVFVALDPATRFAEARDAIRQNDVQELLSAIKLYQVDHEWVHLSSIQNIQGNGVHMIVDGAMATGCNAYNDYCTTNVSANSTCVNLAQLVTAGYLEAVPISPAGEVVWDDGSTSGEKGTGFTLEVSNDGLVTVRTCEEEETSTEIQASR